MQAINCLMKVSQVLPQPSYFDIKLHDQEGQETFLKAFFQHPDRTTLLTTCYNLLVEFLWGRTAVLVKVENEPQPLYMQVDDLSQRLGISKNIIQQQQDLTSLILEHERSLAIQEINEIAKNSLELELNEGDKKDLSALAQLFPPFNLVEIIHQKDSLDKSKMILTMIEIGKHLSDSQIIKPFYKKRRRKSTFAFYMDDRTILINQEKIAKENSKKVNVALNLKTNKYDMVRLKVKTKYSEHAVTRTLFEVEIMKKLHDRKSRYIADNFYAKVYDEQDPNRLNLFQTRYLGDGTLLREATFPPMTAPQQLNCFKEVALGIADLHELEYAHMDLRPANFVLVENGARLIDFGQAQKFGEIPNGGAPFYWPPETNFIFKPDPTASKITSKIDSFSLGVSILDTYAGTLDDIPILRDQAPDQTERVIETIKTSIASRADLSDRDKKIIKGLLNLCYKLLDYDAHIRITCRDAGERLQALQNESKQW